MAEMAGVSRDSYAGLCKTQILQLDWLSDDTRETASSETDQWGRTSSKTSESSNTSNTCSLDQPVEFLAKVVDETAMCTQSKSAAVREARGAHEPTVQEIPSRCSDRRFSHPVVTESSESMLEMFQIPREDLKLTELVGSGAAAHVFKGKWHGKMVAVKRLKLGRRAANQLKKQSAFLREAVIATHVSHPNLVQFHGIAFEKEPYLLVSEFCRGDSVYNLLYQNELELAVKQIVKMASDIASAMDYLHTLQPQIVHRDLKSLNLLLRDKVNSTTDIPHVKVADFGLSKMLHRPEDADAAVWTAPETYSPCCNEPRARVLMTKDAGTAHWMAPEVYKKYSRDYADKVDVYSFAMVMFELASEEVPFEDLEPSDVKEAVLSGERPDMEAVPPFMPQGYVQLMQDCWTQSPMLRPSFAHIWSTLQSLSKKL